MAWQHLIQRTVVRLLTVLVFISVILVAILSFHRHSDDLSDTALIQRRSIKDPTRRVTSLTATAASHRGYVAPNEILKSTAIGVKTYNRPDCLREFITSVRTFAPYLTIVVVDDSEADARMTFLQGQDQGDVYVMLPTDSGTGYGRNRIVQAVAQAGFRYLLMADDDYKLTSAETIPMMARYLQETGADVVAATRCDHTLENCKRNKGMLVLDQQRNLTILPNVTVYPSYTHVPTCFRSDLVQQFFLGRVDKLLQVGWDDKLKNNDHYDFLLNAKQHQLSLVTCSDILILHEKTCESLSLHQASYQQVRADRWYDLLGYIFRKWNLRYMHDEVGKLLWVNATGRGVARQTDVQRYPTTSKESKDLVSLVTGVLNAWKPGWVWTRPVFTKKTWAIRKEYGPCVNLISGAMEYEYDRHKSFKNQMQSAGFSQFIYNETCSFAEQFWNVTHYGSYNSQAHVYYVTAVSDDIAYLTRLFHVLEDQTTRSSLTLIVVVMDKISAAALETNKQLVGFELIILNVGPPFSRSIGLRVGFEHAIDLAVKRGQTDAIGFSVDTSVLLPPDFTERIRRGAICSVSSFVPIVFKCISCTQGDIRNLTDGYWVNSGFGMMGLCLSDYSWLGGWSVEWGYRWGGEDVDMMERIMRSMPHVVRAKEEGYMHVRDAAVKKNNPGYYKAKNIFPRALPPSSLTVEIKSEEMLNRSITFIKKSIPEFKHIDVGSVKMTRTYLTDGKEILYHTKLTNRHDETDSRWVIIHSFFSPVL